MVDAQELTVERLEEALEQPQDAAVVEAATAVVDAPYTLSHLEAEHCTVLFERLSNTAPRTAANLLETLEDAQGTEIVASLPPQAAARVMQEVDSDVCVDLLKGLETDHAEAVLSHLDDGYSLEIRRMMQYPADVAGGLMITEFLCYPNTKSVTDVIEDLRNNGESYREFEVRYVYAVDEAQRFVGHVSVRQLLLTPHGRRLCDVGTKDVTPVTVHTPLSDLENLIDRSEHVALPVLDPRQRLVGVITRAAVQEALKELRAAELLKFGGIIGGEELRAMPYFQRTLRRMAFLLPNVLLSYAAVSVIALYEPMIARLTALAVLLPMVANLTGAAGNQAVAVSIRELTLDVATPRDWFRVLRQELLVGVANGIVIGVLLALLTVATRGSWLLGLTVGAACAIGSVVAVGVGSCLPLGLRRAGVDPAMMSSPILTTLTDMASFFLTLQLAMRIFGPIE